MANSRHNYVVSHYNHVSDKDKKSAKVFTNSMTSGSYRQDGRRIVEDVSYKGTKEHAV